LSSNWLDPLNKLKIADAVRRRKEMVTLANGVTLVIEYYPEPHDLIYIRNADKYHFTPCGYFPRKTVLSETWLS
jgi:hypothetical protein